MYAMSIHVRDAREYDSSRFASQKRRKTQMRRAIIDRHLPAREYAARAVFRLQNVASGGRKRLA